MGPKQFMDPQHGIDLFATRGDAFSVNLQEVDDLHRTFMSIVCCLRDAGEEELCPKLPSLHAAGRLEADGSTVLSASSGKD